MDLGTTEIWSSLSLEQLNFNILFEAHSARLYHRCHLQLLVKSTVLDAHLVQKSSIFFVVSFKNRIIESFLVKRNIIS